MKTSRCALSVIAICVISLNTQMRAAQLSESEEQGTHKTKVPQAFEVERSALLKGRGSLKSRIDLGDFPCNAVVSCSIDVVNLTDRDLQFDRIESGCGCLSVSPARGHINQIDGLTFKAKVQTPQNPRRIDRSATFTGFKGDRPVFSIRLEYQLTGAIGFVFDSVQVKVPIGRDELTESIPFFVDKSTSPEFIEVTAGGRLEGIGISVDHKSNLVELTVPAKIVADGPLAGELKIRNLKSGFTGKLPVFLSQDFAISVFPSNFRFEQSGRNGAKSEDEKPFEAIIMVIDSNREVSEKVAAVADVYIGKELLKSSVVRTQGKVTHLRVSASRALLESKTARDRQVTCRIIGKNSKRTLTLPYSVGSPSISLH